MPFKSSGLRGGTSALDPEIAKAVKNVPHSQVKRRDIPGTPLKPSPRVANAA
jgi:hypothetical protein